MHHWEVCPEEGTPHDLNVVTVPKSFLIWDFFYLKIGVKETK